MENREQMNKRANDVWMREGFYISFDRVQSYTTGAPPLLPPASATRVQDKITPRRRVLKTKQSLSGLRSLSGRSGPQSRWFVIHPLRRKLCTPVWQKYRKCHSKCPISWWKMILVQYLLSVIAVFTKYSPIKAHILISSSLIHTNMYSVRWYID